MYINRDIKQVIVMRNDLNMRKGKMVAQGAHASIMWLLLHGNGAFSEAQAEWISCGMTKICVRVDSLDQLIDIHKKAQDAGLAVHIIQDAGLTEFKEPTYTCLAIGPDEAAKINPITGELKLL